ncbi:MAG: helix-turn-helix domain-containing protein [Geminicoccaceae bacterium]
MFRKNAYASEVAKAEEIIGKIGVELRRIRTMRDESLEDVAAYLEIKSIYLFGIEQGDLSVIPSQRSRRSYTSSYANYLGLDGDVIVNRVLPLIKSLDNAPTRSSLRSFSRIDRNSAVILASSIVLGIITGWLYLGDTARLDLIATPVTAGAVGNIDDGEPTADDQVAGDQAPNVEEEIIEDSLKEAEQALAELEDQLAEEQASEQTAAKQEIPANVLATLVAKQRNGAQIYEPENTDARVIVRALDTSWIQVSSADRSYLWTRTMQPQEMLLVPNRDDLELWAGDASGVEILLDGVVLPTIGPPGTVVRGLSLAPTSLEAISQTVGQEGSKKPTF